MAGRFFDKLLDYIGLEDDEMGEEYSEQSAYYGDTQEMPDENVVQISNHGKSRGKVVSMPAASASTQMKMIVYHPISYEDTQNIIDNLKTRKPVVVNMEDLELESAQRILDFMAGAVYAISGNIHKISRGIFVVAPNNVGIVTHQDEDTGPSR